MAAIAAGTTAAQRHFVTRLAELPTRVAAEGLASPAILVIGDVAAFAQRGGCALSGSFARHAA